MQKSLKILLQQIKIWLSNYDSTILFNISRTIGETLLIGGWLIFILWVVGRYLVAYDLEILAFLGLLWVIIGIWVGAIGLILLIIYMLLNIKELHLSILSALFIILLNIPSVFLILKLQGKINKKTFVLFENNSKIDNLKIDFIRESSKIYIGELDTHESNIFNYEPKHRIEDSRLYQEQEILFIEIKSERGNELIEFPELANGTCYKINLNEKLEIEKKKRIFWEIE